MTARPNWHKVLQLHGEARRAAREAIRVGSRELAKAHELDQRREAQLDALESLLEAVSAYLELTQGDGPCGPWLALEAAHERCQAELEELSG